MAFKLVTITNCCRASIRRKPWIPTHSNEIVGIRDGPTYRDNTVKQGDSLEIDLENICYDWTGRKFYKVRNPDGWIYEGCVNIGDGVDDN